MSEQARSTLGRPARRREIVDTARAIAAEQGWAAVTVRAVAGRIGCSAPAIYQYFRDKDAVLDALAAEGHALLASALEDAAVQRSGTAKKLRAMIKALWSFSLSNRELYAVMFGLDGLAAHRGVSPGGVAPATLVRASAEFLAKRHQDDAAQDVAEQLFATAHGFICLVQAGDFLGGSDRAFDLLSRTLDIVLKNIGRHS
jgi:AcrR family transcriptional regulator